MQAKVEFDLSIQNTSLRAKITKELNHRLTIGVFLPLQQVKEGSTS